MVRHHLGVPDRTSRLPTFPIRQIALDIDGTLVGDDLVVGPRTRAAIQRGDGPGVSVSLVTGRMVSSAMRFATELGLTAPVVGYQGGLIREMTPPGSTRLGKLLVHLPLPADVARDIVAWTIEHRLDPHVNHLERFILRQGDPNAGDYSAFMGAPAEFLDDLRSISHPVTKVLAVGDPPTPVDIAPTARDRVRRPRRRHDQPPEVPGVRGAGRVEGPGRPLPGSPARDLRSGRRSRSATSGTTWRCWPKSGMGRRCRRRRSA